MRIDSRSRLRRTLLLCGLLVLVPGVARAWRTSLPGVGMARAVAVEADGRVVAAGEIAGTGETLFSVVLFDALAGTSIWRKDVAAGEATGIALDASGDILASGFIGSKDGAGIVKLDDLTGNESWRFRVPRSVVFPGRSVAAGRAVNGDGLLAIGRTSVAGDRVRTIVYRLGNASGAVVWRKNLGKRIALEIAPDSNGDVIVAVAEKNPSQGSGIPGPQDPAKIYKLNRATGAVLWGASPGLRAEDLLAVVTTTDDVVVAGRPDLDGSATVVALAKLTGREQWRRVVGGSGAIHLAAGPDGDVVVAVDQAGPLAGAQVARLAAADGAPVWDQAIDSGSGTSCGAAAFFVTPAGNPILGGCVSSPPAADFRFQLTSLSGAKGQLRWRRGIDGLSPDLLAVSLPVRAIAADQSGNLVAAGGAAGGAADGTAAPAFTVVKWNDDRGDDLLLPAERTCRATIVSAARNYIFTRLQTVESCRDRINAGLLDLGFDECAKDSSYANTMKRLTTRTRNSIVSDCAGPNLPEGVSCGRTIDELLNEPKTSGQVGCLLDTDDQVGDEIADTVYAKSLTGTSAAVRSCQTAIGTAGRRIFDTVMSAAVDCRARGAGDLSECEGTARFEQLILDNALAQRGRIASNCTTANLAATGTCAATLDGLIAPTGTSGCLLEVSRRGAIRAARAQD